MDQSLSQAEIIVDENRVELLYIKSNITNMRDDFNDLEANCTEKIQELQGLFHFIKIPSLILANPRNFNPRSTGVVRGLNRFLSSFLNRTYLPH